MDDLNTSTVEIWKPIPTWEGLYRVSNTGRVESIGGYRPNRILRGTVNQDGYFAVTLNHLGRQTRRTVHGLVMWAFTGPRPDQMQVNHKNGIKTDNRLDNLEYCTPQENIRHSFSLGLSAKGADHWTRVKPHMVARGSKSGLATLTEDAIPVIRQLKQQGYSYQAIANHLGVGKSAVQHAYKGRSWRHVT